MANLDQLNFTKMVYFFWHFPREIYKDLRGLKLNLRAGKTFRICIPKVVGFDRSQFRPLTEKLETALVPLKLRKGGYLPLKIFFTILHILINLPSVLNFDKIIQYQKNKKSPFALSHTTSIRVVK